jgi:hypothetical protein
MGIIATHCPELNYGAPELMVTADAGKTYTVASYPLGHMEIRSARDGYLMRPGPEWDENSDYTPEGQTIRIPGNRTRTFSAGPYASYVPVPTTLDGSTAPVLKPAFARLLLIPRACYLYATSRWVPRSLALSVARTAALGRRPEYPGRHRHPRHAEDAVHGLGTGGDPERVLR